MALGGYVWWYAPDDNELNALEKAIRGSRSGLWDPPPMELQKGVANDSAQLLSKKPLNPKAAINKYSRCIFCWRHANKMKNRRTEYDLYRIGKEKLEKEKAEIEKLEEEKLRLQQQNIEREKVRLEKIKQDKLKELQDIFNKHFWESDSYYKKNLTKYFTFDIYKEHKIRFVQSWIQKNTSIDVDNEQADAIASTNKHVQVVARAGSGKTRTLVNRTIFLQKHCGVSPGEMLLLAFNRKAAEEMRERLEISLGANIPHTMTFHALAYSLVHPDQPILFDEQEGEQSKSRAMQGIIDDFIRSPKSKYQKMIREVMMAHFKQDWERIVSGGYHKSPEAIVRYRRSLRNETLAGGYVKSYGEKLIADFLFEHDIAYKYERNFWWDGINYKPDFTIPTSPTSGIVIEYFGMTGNLEYDRQTKDKLRFWKKENDWVLIDLYKEDISPDDPSVLLNVLKENLTKLEIKCEPLPEEEIWNRVKDRAIDRFTKVIVGFIQRCRQLTYTLEQLVAVIKKHQPASETELMFLRLGYIFYKNYLNRVEDTGEDDFDGLMQEAVGIIIAGKTVFRRRKSAGDLNNLRHILIDEYQDFSHLFDLLISSIKRQNPTVEIFCVGDDWQAINAFAGSDLKYFHDFPKKYEDAHVCLLTSNYRSNSSIVKTGNSLMYGFGTPSESKKPETGKVFIANLNEFSPDLREQSEHPGDIITPAVLRLIFRVLENGHTVSLLSRKNWIDQQVNFPDEKYRRNQNDLELFQDLIRTKLPKSQRDKVNVSTVHKYKGLESDVVIILDAILQSYPLLHPDIMFTRVFGDDLDKIIAEERRLFYVALTRAINDLFIITDAHDMSPFLEDIKAQTNLKNLVWSDYPSPKGTSKLYMIKISNLYVRDTKPTIKIKDHLKADGFKWSGSRGRVWCKSISVDRFSIDQIKNDSSWSNLADGIQVLIYDDYDQLIAEYQIKDGTWTTIKEDYPSGTLGSYLAN